MTVATKARAWAIKRADAFVLGFTDHDRDLQFEGIHFCPDHGMSARTLVQATGLSVDNSEAEGALSDEAISETDLMLGRWDGAEIRLWEVNWADVRDRRLLFCGLMGEVTRLDGVFRAELRGLSEALFKPGGRVFHRRCSAQLGDAACSVRLGDERFTAELELHACDNGRTFRFDRALAFPEGWFGSGMLEVLSGAATGLKGHVRFDSVSPAGVRQIELWSGMAIAPQPGDRVKLVAGCDKAAGTCRTKFGNFANFRGFPHLPSEDWLMAPRAGGRHG